MALLFIFISQRSTNCYDIFELIRVQKERKERMKDCLALKITALNSMICFKKVFLFCFCFYWIIIVAQDDWLSLPAATWVIHPLWNCSRKGHCILNVFPMSLWDRPRLTPLESWCLSAQTAICIWNTQIFIENFISLSFPIENIFPLIIFLLSSICSIFT